ncbi:MAG: CHASE2 domain-containing protein [Gammaproteobacteria bacterium]
MSIHALVRLLLSLGLVAIALLHAAGFVRLEPLEGLENFIYDKRLVATLPGGKDPRVVVIDIDEQSLAEIGRWPWSREKIGRMVDQLFDRYEVEVLGFDVLFAEPDRSSGLSVLRELAVDQFGEDSLFQSTLERITPSLQYDRLFAESLRGRNTVMGFAASDQDGTVNRLPKPVMSADDPVIKALPLVERKGVTGNLPILQEAAASGGFFDNALVGTDGIFRRMPMIYVHDGQVYESLSLAMFRLFSGSPAIVLQVADDAGYTELEAIRFGEHGIPVDQNGAALVPYRGAYGSFNYISAADVLAGRADPELLKGTLAILGSTAAGLLDLRATPVNHVYPGVEIHANILSALLNPQGNGFKQAPGYALGYDVAMILVLGLILAFALPRLSALLAVALTAAAMAASIFASFYFWTGANLAMPSATQLVLVLSIFILQMSYSFFVEARNRRQLGRMFGQYVPPEIVDEMDSNPNADFGMEGDSRNMSVLFSDVRGFTTLSEQIKPNELTRMMNAFLTPMTGVIHHTRGTVDKYMGDAIMAFWGAPLPDENHASNAVRAGLEMIEELPKINAALEQNGWPAIKVGVGVNTGPMNVGNMGSEFRMAYTVLGDAVNLGSRLEGLTKQYGVLMIVSEYTKAQAPEYLYRELDLVRVKGKKEPVAIFEPLGRDGEVDEATVARLKRYHNALKLYRRQQWDQAEMNFASLAAEHPDELLFQVYLERIPALRADPPGKGWDAVYTHTSK